MLGGGTAPGSEDSSERWDTWGHSPSSALVQAVSPWPSHSPCGASVFPIWRMESARCPRGHQSGRLKVGYEGETPE